MSFIFQKYQSVELVQSGRHCKFPAECHSSHIGAIHPWAVGSFSLLSWPNEIWQACSAEMTGWRVLSSIQKMQDRTRADTKPSRSWEALVADFSGLHEALSCIGDQWIALARRTVREAVWVDMWPSLPQNSSFTLVGWWHKYLTLENHSGAKIHWTPS